MTNSYELSFIVTCDEAVAESLLEAVTEQICAATGGIGEGEAHVCRGFVAGSIREFEAEM